MQLPLIKLMNSVAYFMTPLSSIVEHYNFCLALICFGFFLIAINRVSLLEFISDRHCSFHRIYNDFKILDSQISIVSRFFEIIEYLFTTPRRNNNPQLNGVPHSKVSYYKCELLYCSLVLL